MKYYIYFLAYIYLKLQVRASISGEMNLENYLHKKMISLSVEQEVRLKRNTSEYTIEHISSHDNKDSWQFAYSFSIFNDNYMMFDRDIYETFKGNMMITKIASVVEDDRRITKAKIIQFGDIALMFVVLNNKFVKVIKFEHTIDEYQEIQTIEQVQVSDASFFVNRKNLYLIVSNAKGNNLVPISIYQWRDNQFDEQITFYMKGITQMKTFEDAGIEVILMLKETMGSVLYCNVYEFDDHRLNKKQVIRVDGPRFVLPYMINHEYYVLFLNNNKESEIYRWSGFELMKWSTQKIIGNFSSTLIMYTNNITPIIFASQQGSVSAYKPTSELMELVNTVKYKRDFTEILDMSYTKRNESDLFSVVGNIEDSGIIETFKVDHSQPKIVIRPAAEDTLHICLTELDVKLNPAKEIFTSIRGDTARSMPSYSMKSRDNEFRNIELEDTFKEINKKFTSLNHIIGDLKEPSEEMKVNGDVIGDTLKGYKLKTENVVFKEVNGELWSPNQWLSYTKDQTISGGIDANNLTLINLKTTPEVDIFDDLFLNNNNSTLSGSISINYLKTNKMLTTLLNNVKMEQVFMRDRDLVATGMKTFSHITADSVESLNIQNKNTEEILDLLSTQNDLKTIKFAPNVIIDDLQIEDIDGINWNTFKDSIFRYGVTSAITGNLKVKSFEVEHLDLVTLNGVTVDNFMTTSTDQTINSSLTFHHIYASNITANTINGISLLELAATAKNPYIKGPVSIEDIHILGDLILNNSIDDSTFLKKNQHIVGTDVSDLLQMYTGKVKIRGDLRVKNLKTVPFSSIIIGKEEEEFDPRIPENYWMKNKIQIVPVHVEMQGGLKTPHLQTKLLNGNGISNYMLNNSSKTFPASFAFENVTFLGNIYLNDQKIHTPDLRRTDAESVKVNGSFVVHGKTIFRDSLRIKNLRAEKMNDVEQDDLMAHNKISKFTAKKVFENLVISGDLSTNELFCPEMNGVDLLQLQQEAIFIDRPQELESLTFNSVSIENLNVETLNNRIIDEFRTETNGMFNSGVIDSLIINGELSIGDLRNLSKINEKDPDILHRNKLKLDEQGVLHGNVKFLNNVNIENLSAAFINNINFPYLTSRLLYKKGEQDITGRFTFENLKTRDFVAPIINGFSIDPLVNVRSTEPQKIIAFSGIEFNSATLTILHGDNISPCNVEDAMEAMKSPPTQTWGNMRINGNVTILDRENPLCNIIENVVLTSYKNVITAPVHFSNISVENLTTSKNINGIDVSSIFSDALRKESDEEQIISGFNIFERLGIYSALVNNNSDIPIVNSIELSKIAKQMISRDEVNHIPIRGRKTFFAGLQTEKIECQQVSEIFPEDLVTIDNGRIIPVASFENVKIIEDLHVDRINDQDFNFFLEERLLLAGPYLQDVTAIYSFNDVHIAGNVTTKSINDVEIDDVVFDMNNQKITSRKTFQNDVYITGNVDIEMLNGYMISEIYQKTLLKNEESYIKKNVEIMRPSVVNGTITTQYINGYSIESMKSILNPETRHQNIEEIHEVIQAIENSAKINYELIERMPSEIMYIEKSNTLQLAFPNTADARVLRLKDFILIHITGEEKGSECGLTEHCLCPVQHTIQISPQNSINSFANKGTQRVYSFDDKFMTVHVMTDSVSTNLNCRVNSSTNETTTLAWNTIASSNNTGAGFTYRIDFNGYVSSVEYFTVNGMTYAIVGKYYDPIADSYDLDFVVLKFDRNRNSISEIQRQRTSGIWSLKIFYSAQGVNLIVGMLGNGQQRNNFEKTLVMRFDEQQEQFFLLREVQAYGCSSSVGIVLGAESFIALAHKKYPVLIFRYDSSQDNYIYYQNLWDPLPISGISLFYTGGFGISDPYLCVVSERGVYSIYTYEYIEGWKRKFHREMKGLRNLVPFELNGELYLFAPSTNMSSVLNVVKFG